ncbi:Abi family protein [Deminuibacter soli]
MSSPRMNRYRNACAGQSKKSMTLYRQNLRLSQEMFTVISCFEIALRNAVDRHYTINLGFDWLRDSVTSGGKFNNARFRITIGIIKGALQELHAYYTHPKLVAKMDFGFWRYLFAPNQYRALGQTLLQIFPAKPISTSAVQYNAAYVFSELKKINNIRNRIAHHEPICFQPANPIIDTTYARQHYNLILQLFQWMNINEAALLYGLDHINAICNDIDNL